MPIPLSQLDASNIIGLFFDIDDTLSTRGRITAEAYSSMWDLANAGKVVVPVTGRPAGWCDMIARMWPVTAVIGENGAFYFMMKDGRMKKEYAADRAEIPVYKRKLASIRDEILREVPACAIASDQNYREFDLAIDFSEDVPRLSESEIKKIEDIFRKYGAVAKRSSIHINGWFGSYNKLGAVKMFVRKELGLDLDAENGRFIFCGDSPNDEPMFEYFKKSVGVANVMEFGGILKIQPKYITSKTSGEGFKELSEHIIRA